MDWDLAYRVQLLFMVEIESEKKETYNLAFEFYKNKVNKWRS